MLTDVIAALATPPGTSALALVRISGDGAHDVAARVLRPFDALPARHLRRSVVVDRRSGERIDDVLYATFEAPSSYTGEDAVEISTHGGVLVPVEVLDALFQAGARLAEPGEFTRRALLNGKMDLLQAEAVGDLIAASSPAQRRAALNQLDRGLTRRIEDLRARVLDLEKLVCYEIDFPEEDSGPISPQQIQNAIDVFRASCKALLASAVEGERLREGAVVVIAGLPNTGKSSLFNALLGMERAIVTEVAGTTRDAIEAPLSCEGFPIRLVDTAGLRSTEDLVEQKGIEVSHRYLRGADAILFCADSGRSLSDDEREFLEGCDAPHLVVWTKMDLAGHDRERPGVGVSTRTGAGLVDLRTELARLAFGRLLGATDLDPILTRARHRTALERALSEVDEFDRARVRGIETAVAAVHLRAAATALEVVIGMVSQEDVLDAVFSTFCIGK